MQLNLHQTHHQIGDFEAIFEYLSQTFLNSDQSGLHIFPELFTVGYPLQDLVLKKSFIDEYNSFIADLSLWSLKQLKSKNELFILVGGLHYEFDSEGHPTNISNVAYSFGPGKPLEIIYTKMLLPNYDIYDEKKYFTPGEQIKIIEFEGHKIAITICEDMWFSHLHKVDPIAKIKESEEFIDLIVNMSASPFNIYKSKRRIDRAKEISQFLNAPFAYVNRVGAEDDILFDGESFVVNGDLTLVKAQSFKPQVLSIPLPEYRDSGKKLTYTKNSNSWSEIYSNELDLNTLRLKKLGDEKCKVILEALQFAIYDYALKSNMHKFTLALSGGIDSSLVLAIIALMKEKYHTINGKKIEIEAIFMPSQFSSSLSYDLSYDLCQKLKVTLTSFPIKFIHSVIKNAFKDTLHKELTGLADENIQSRIRGNLIYARSNQIGSMVLNTSNKSELAVGYSTLYGDSVGAISILGDLYKSDIFEISHYINTNIAALIPEEIINRPPSAELRENQTDAQSLPPYDVLDAILEGMLSMSYSPLDLVKLGLDKMSVEKVFQLYSKSEYKRRQFCPIIKIRPRSFGFGYRIPISKKPF